MFFYLIVWIIGLHRVVYFCLKFFLSVSVMQFSSGSKNVEKGETVYHLRPHLLQTCTTKYAFYTAFWKKISANGGGAAAPTPPFESAIMQLAIFKFVCALGWIPCVSLVLKDDTVCLLQFTYFISGVFMGSERGNLPTSHSSNSHPLPLLSLNWNWIWCILVLKSDISWLQCQ